MTERPQPDEVIEHGQVTLRRYWVHRACTRRRLATTAAAALVEQAFRLPGVDRVEIVHDELNVASGGVPRKLGFSEAGRRPLELPSPRGTGVGVVWRLVR